MADLGKNQNYLNRDYQSIRSDLMNLLKVHYPDQFQDFNSASIGMSLVELMAYVSDILSYNTDKRFNEMFLDGVTERSAVFRLAKTFGYSPVGYRPAMSIADIEIEVPPTADGPNTSYLPVFRPGVQVKGVGQVFETVNECDFSSDYSEDGVANRKILPVFNANQDILRYRIIKREKIKAGFTTIYKKEISISEASTPFFQITLPENNVLEIISIICKPSLNLFSPPTFSEFNDSTIRYFEVDDLAQKQIFLSDDTQPTVNGVSSGRFVDVPQRFLKEFMADGTCKIIFGGGTADYDAYETYLSNIAINDSNIELADVFNNNALGVKLPANSTLYVQYRIGGGSLSNVGANTLQQIGNVDAVFVGTDSTIQQSVINSARATNPLPAIGGGDLQTVEEIKYLIASNFAAQKRCVTLQDYIARAYQLPGKYGTPFRIHGKVEDNKVKLYILTKDANGKIGTRSTSVIKNNLVEYMIPYRMINDFVEINDGKVIDLQIEVDLFVDKTYNSNEVKVNVINMIKDFMNIDKWQMNQHIYISQIVDAIREIPGIINVVDIRFYNMEGGIYSTTLISQATGQRENILHTGMYRTQIEPIKNAIFSTPVSMWQIRQPETDILVRCT